MHDATGLNIVRRAFAQQLLFLARVNEPRLEMAFASVRREDFLGAGPWSMVWWGAEYRATPSADPVYLYMDVVFTMVPARRINNGQPSFHAKLLASAAIGEGEHVVHVGAGTGYYTAVMAHLAGASGRVTAIEIDPELAARATGNLAHLPNVRVVEGDGCTVPFEPADAIYVNAGATHPAAAWLDGLREGGRLILPLTTDKGFGNKEGLVPGAVFRIERSAEGYLARWISPVGIIPCEGARDAVPEAALAAALQKGGWERVTRLYRNEDVPEDRCWLKAPGWALAYS
jgi:protein-L-isoaspartate(D-aspartate) O-methyltransferase